jgi:ABC-type nickel/cobalt efflux system permease component RcnA
MNLLVAVTILAYLHTCIFAAARFLFEILSVLLIITLPALWHVCSGDSELSPQQRHKPLTTTTWRAITYFGVAVGLCIGLAGSLGGHFKKGPDTLLFFQQLVGLPVPPATDEPLLPL